MCAPSSTVVVDAIINIGTAGPVLSTEPFNRRMPLSAPGELRTPEHWWAAYNCVFMVCAMYVTTVSGRIHGASLFWFLNASLNGTILPCGGLGEKTMGEDGNCGQ